MNDGRITATLSIPFKALVFLGVLIILPATYLAIKEIERDSKKEATKEEKKEEVTIDASGNSNDYYYDMPSTGEGTGDVYPPNFNNIQSKDVTC